MVLICHSLKVESYSGITLEVGEKMEMICDGQKLGKKRLDLLSIGLGRDHGLKSALDPGTLVPKSKPVQGILAKAELFSFRVVFF